MQPHFPLKRVTNPIGLEIWVPLHIFPPRLEALRVLPAPNSLDRRFFCWAAAKCHGIQVQLWAGQTLDLPPFHYIDILARRAQKKRNGQNGLSQATPVRYFWNRWKSHSSGSMSGLAFHCPKGESRRSAKLRPSTNKKRTRTNLHLRHRPASTQDDVTPVGFAVSDGVATAVSVTWVENGFMQTNSLEKWV